MTDWQGLLSYAVLGRSVAGPSTSAPDLTAVERLLWDSRDEAARARREALQRGESWPFPLPEALRAQVPSVAQFLAARQRVVEQLDLDAHGAPATRAPDADERRLLAERPPHFGTVG